MKGNIINLVLAFLEGFVLIISPCILPILPIILSGSISGDKKRPWGIILGFILFFSLFTFFSRKLTEFSGIDLNLIRDISYVLLLLLGIVMLSSYLTERFNHMTQRFAELGTRLSPRLQHGFLGGVLFGGLVGLIWTPCAGPILAAVILQTVIQTSTIMSFLTLLAFAVGVAIPMLIIVLLGRQFLQRFSVLRTHAIAIRKILGLIIILSVFYLIYSESNFIATSPVVSTSQNAVMKFQNEIDKPYPAPEINGIDSWINSAPLQISDLKGKVVLIDFWTYSCINCIRTLPYLKDWYQKYHDKGFTIIGIHTPEFEFEKNLANVQNAVKKYGILYPVALDSHFVTWQNYQNSYWPAHYLIDQHGKVVYTHFGEGEYDITENNIRYLLGEKSMVTAPKPVEKPATLLETPETYLGYARAEQLVSPETVVHDAPAQYHFPTTLGLHEWALQGPWLISAEKITAVQSQASIEIKFYARKVFVVMGVADGKEANVQVLLNDKPLIKTAGKDLTRGALTVTKHALYEVVALEKPANGLLKLTTTAPGLEMYTFTFGE